MNRQQAVRELGAASEPWDFIIIGGGATGLGTAVDAANRGYRTLLVEQHDFAKGTSSRSTKLLHGGVRYLKQGDLSLVTNALRERGIIRANAPHVARTLGFVIPAYSWMDKPFYGVGLTLYDRLAGKLGLGHSKVLSRERTLERLPTIRKERLRGGILYYDAQFDDARLAVNLAQTAAEKGALVVNYARVAGLIMDGGRVTGVRVRDEESGKEYEPRARCVVNATGVYCDAVRRMESENTEPMLVASQGSHLVLPREFQPGSEALMVPKTADGRVLFALPWHDRVVIGTTDIPVDDIPIEPRPLEAEIDFMLEHAAMYLEKAPAPGDVLSAYSGLRPLVGRAGAGRKTSSLSRDHTIVVSDAGLVSVTGGKWTTYRSMAAGTLDRAEACAGFDHRSCRTRELRLHGWTEESAGAGGKLAIYGSDAKKIEGLARKNPELRQRVHPRLDCIRAEVVWAARHEMARSVEDVLARRTRALLLDARASMEAAPVVAGILAAELDRDESWRDRQIEAFRATAKNYLIVS